MPIFLQPVEQIEHDFLRLGRRGFGQKNSGAKPGGDGGTRIVCSDDPTLFALIGKVLEETKRTLKRGIFLTKREEASSQCPRLHSGVHTCWRFFKKGSLVRQRHPASGMTGVKGIFVVDHLTSGKQSGINDLDPLICCA